MKTSRHQKREPWENSDREALRSNAPAYAKAPSGRQAPRPKVKDLEEKFRVFLDQCPAQRLSRNLRTMLLEFMMTSGTEAPYVKDLLLDLESLFILLDAIEDHSFSPQRRKGAEVC